LPAGGSDIFAAKGVRVSVRVGVVLGIVAVLAALAVLVVVAALSVLPHIWRQSLGWAGSTPGLEVVVLDEAGAWAT
jgi:hypothetical protein